MRVIHVSVRVAPVRGALSIIIIIIIKNPTDSVSTFPLLKVVAGHKENRRTGSQPSHC